MNHMVICNSELFLNQGIDHDLLKSRLNLGLVNSNVHGQLINDVSALTTSSSPAATRFGGPQLVSSSDLLAG